HSIAHDLRAPLRAINSFASRIVHEHSSGLSSEGQRLLQVVTTQAMHMSTMVDDYLPLSGLARVGLVYEQIDMTELAKEAWSTAITGVSRPPALYLESLPPAYGDRGLLRQVWTNALSNAVKFTRDSAAPEVRITGSEDDKVVRYCVKDNGIGFDPAH